MQQMNINMQVINHKDQRYDTLGDWQFLQSLPDGTCWVNIRVSELGDAKMNFLLQFHELIEAVLCAAHFITSEDVDKFDISHPELSEPGEDLRAPYHKEHMIADAFERMMSIHLGVDWSEYTKRVNEISGKSL
jgi:hypothetical protein